MSQKTQCSCGNEECNNVTPKVANPAIVIWVVVIFKCVNIIQRINSNSFFPFFLLFHAYWMYFLFVVDVLKIIIFGLKQSGNVNAFMHFLWLVDTLFILVWNIFFFNITSYWHSPTQPQETLCCWCCWTWWLWKCSKPAQIYMYNTGITLNN